MILKSVLAASLLVSAGSASAANIVTNGGFEAPTIANSCCNTVPGNGTLPGWSVTSGNVNVVNGTFGSSNGNLANTGSQYLDLIGEGAAGTISQVLATLPNRAYRLTFSYAHNLFGGGTPSASADFSFGGVTSSVTHSTGSTSNLDWQTYSGIFSPTGSSTTLSFTNTSPTSGNAGLFLDSISVSAVPEPATWGMMIAGFGFVGASMRRRRRELLATA